PWSIVTLPACSPPAGRDRAESRSSARSAPPGALLTRSRRPPSARLLRLPCARPCVVLPDASAPRLAQGVDPPEGCEVDDDTFRDHLASGRTDAVQCGSVHAFVSDRHRLAGE